MRKFVFNATRTIYGAFFCAILIIVTFCAGIDYAFSREFILPNIVPLILIFAVFAVCFIASSSGRTAVGRKKAPSFDRAAAVAVAVLLFLQIHLRAAVLRPRVRRT